MINRTTSVPPRSELSKIIIGVVQNPLGLMGLVIVGLLVLSAIFAQWIFNDPIAMNIGDRLHDPSATFF